MPRRMRAFLVLLVIAAVMFAAAGCGASTTVAVTTATAANQELSASVDLSGVLAPAQMAEISSQIAGKVTSLGYQTGDAVKAGDVLMQLDTAALNAQLAQAEAGLQSADAALRAAGNQVALAKINLVSAREAYARTEALFTAGATTQSALDDATNALNTAQKQYDNASGAASDQAQATVSTAQANIAALEVQLDETTIRSPLDGVLSGRNVNVGEVVSPGVAVMSVADDSSLKFTGTVTQDQLPFFSLGQEMNVYVDSFPGHVYKGTITTLGPIAVNTGELFPIEITIANDGRLMAGLTAHAQASVKTSGIVVPSSAVLESGGSSYVFVIKNGVAIKRMVSTGVSSDNETLILKGLAAGEKVAVTNTGALTDNMSVAQQ